SGPWYCLVCCRSSPRRQMCSLLCRSAKFSAICRRTREKKWRWWGAIFFGGGGGGGGGEGGAGPPNGSAGPRRFGWRGKVDTGPKPPGNFELDAAVLNRKFIDLIRHTALGKFRFGTQDYDRWAVVYGRIVIRKGEEAKKAPAELVFRGSGVVIFLTTER